MNDFIIKIGNKRTFRILLFVLNYRNGQYSLFYHKNHFIINWNIKFHKPLIKELSAPVLCCISIISTICKSTGLSSTRMARTASTQTSVKISAM